jgi:hypothetical protein
MYLPSGESCAAAISGLPKITSRSMSCGGPFVLSAFAVERDASRKIHTKTNRSFIRGSSFPLRPGTRVYDEQRTATFSPRLVEGANECGDICRACPAKPLLSEGKGEASAILVLLSSFLWQAETQLPCSRLNRPISAHSQGMRSLLGFRLRSWQINAEQRPSELLFSLSHFPPRPTSSKATGRRLRQGHL